jgi:hypothetical protein
MPLEEKNRLPSASKVRPKRLPPPLAEQLELLCPRMVTPDRLLELVAADDVGGGAAGDAVEPTVRPPGEVVSKGLRVLHAEPGQQHARIAIGFAVAVRIKE